MRLKRVLGYAAAIALVAMICGGVFVTKPFAQMMGGPEGMGGGGMGMGMMGGPGMGGPGGMGGGGGGGRTYTWEEVDMAEELRMSYGEFLAKEGQAPVPFPEFYLMEDDGAPKRYTANQWYSLARVYAERPVQIDTKLVGSPGGQMWRQVYLEAAVKHNEMNTIWTRWCDALTNFWFEVGHPRIGPQALRYDWERKSFHNADGTIGWRRWEATVPDSFTVTIPVVMHVKDRCQQTYGQKFYKAMKKFDNPGHGRSPFKFMTFEGGYYHPHTFHLADETVQAWNDLWGRVQVQLRLYDPENVQVVSDSQASGLTPAIFTQMVHPPTIYYTPRYRLLLPPEDDRFNGGRLNLDGKEGWYFEFEFTLTKDQLRALDDAKARLIVDGGPPQRMKFLAPPDYWGGGTGGGGGMGGMAGGGMGMPGGPGGGEMGMGPPM